MPSLLVPNPASPVPQQCRPGARAGLVLAPLAMAHAGRVTVDVEQSAAAHKRRAAAREHSAECIVAQAVFAGAQVSSQEQPQEE